MGAVTFRRGRVLGCLLVALAVLPLLAAAAQGAPAVSLSPLNGTPDASPYTQISFLGVAAGEISNVSVVGSTGRTRQAEELRHATPGRASSRPPIRPGRDVTPRRRRPEGPQRDIRTSFTIARLANYDEPPGAPNLKGHSLVQASTRNPTSCPPGRRDDLLPRGPGRRHLPDADTGYGQGGSMIVDRRAPDLVPADAQRPDGDGPAGETYRGQPVLVWWQGRVAGAWVSASAHDEIYSISYKPIATINAGNGYQADLHEAQLTPRGRPSSRPTRSTRQPHSSQAGKAKGSCRTRSSRRWTSRRAWSCSSGTPRATSPCGLLPNAGPLHPAPLGLLPSQLGLAGPLGGRQLPRLLTQHVGGLRGQPHQGAVNGGSGASTRASKWVPGQARPTSTMSAGRPTGP